MVMAGTTVDIGYVMEDPREKARLAAKVDPDAWVARYLAPRLRGHEHVLDVGCGPGVIARAVLDACPRATVTAVDRSDDRVAEAARQLTGGRAEVVAADARRLPLPDASVDVAYSRLLLEYLPDREVAIRELVRVCRPAGLVLLQDLDGQLLWHDGMEPSLRRALERVVTALGETGFDPFVGRRLYGLARRAGLEDLEVAVEPYHLYAGRIDEAAYAQWALKLEIASGRIERALGSRRDAEGFRAAFLDHLRDDETLTYSTVFTVVGRRPDAEKTGDSGARSLGIAGQRG